MASSGLSRRHILQLAGAAALPLSSGLLGGGAEAATPRPLTIAYNVNLPSLTASRSAASARPRCGPCARASR